MDKAGGLELENGILADRKRVGAGDNGEKSVEIGVKHSLVEDIITYACLETGDVRRSAEHTTLTALALLAISVTAVALTLAVASIQIVPFQDNLPTNVSASVRACQFLALFYSVFVLQDEIYGSARDLPVLFLLAKGAIDAETEDRGNRRSPLDRCYSLALPLLLTLLRYMLGLLAMVVSVIIICKSSEVIGLFEDFAAFTFIVELDTLILAMVRSRMFGGKLADLVEDRDVEIDVPVREKSTLSTIAFIQTFFCLISIVPVVPFALLMYMQHEGMACPVVEVKFGAVEHMSYATGKYREFMMENGYQTYRQENAEPPVYLHYQAGRSTWCFATAAEYEEHAPKCLVTSEKTKNYNVVAAAAEVVWYVRTDGGIVDAGVDITCQVCSGQSQAEKRASCSNRGQCMTSSGLDWQSAYCECSPDYYGDRCQYPQPCDRFRLENGVTSEGIVHGSDFYAMQFRSTGARALMNERQLYLNADFALTRGKEYVSIAYWHPCTSTWMIARIDVDELPARSTIAAHYADVDEEYVTMIRGRLTACNTYGDFKSSVTALLDPTPHAVYLAGWKEQTNAGSYDESTASVACVDCHVAESDPFCYNGGSCQRLPCDCDEGAYGLSASGRYCRNGECLDAEHCACADGYSGTLCLDAQAYITTTIILSIGGTCYKLDPYTKEYTNSCEPVLDRPFTIKAATFEADAGVDYAQVLVGVDANQVSFYSQEDAEGAHMGQRNCASLASLRTIPRNRNYEATLSILYENSTSVPSASQPACGGIYATVKATDTPTGPHELWNDTVIDWAWVGVAAQISGVA